MTTFRMGIVLGSNLFIREWTMTCAPMMKSSLVTSVAIAFLLLEMSDVFSSLCGVDTFPNKARASSSKIRLVSDMFTALGEVMSERTWVAKSVCVFFTSWFSLITVKRVGT